MEIFPFSYANMLMLTCMLHRFTLTILLLMSMLMLMLMSQCEPALSLFCNKDDKIIISDLIQSSHFTLSCDEQEYCYYCSCLVKLEQQVCKLLIISCIQESVRTVQPICLFYLVSYFMPSSSVTKLEAYLYAVGVTLTSTLSVVLHQLYFFSGHRAGMHMRIATTGCVYRKASINLYANVLAVID